MAGAEGKTRGRRHFLRRLGQAGGGLLVLAAGGTMWRAWDNGVFSRGSGPAFRPWRDWRQKASEGTLALVRAGILAASPHNSQPWLFRLSPDKVELFAALSRNLGPLDPFRRELHIGLGCCLENMVLAATAQNLMPKVHTPRASLLRAPRTGPPPLVARLNLQKAEMSPSPLYDAIGLRHTNRGPYDTSRRLPKTTQRALISCAWPYRGVAIQLFPKDKQRELFGRLVVESTERIIGDEKLVAATGRWMRLNWDQLQRQRDGLSLDCLGLSPWLAALAKILPEPSAQRSHRHWLEATRQVHVASAGAFGLILVHRLYDRRQALVAGRVWQRMHLRAEMLGLAAQPLNQPVELVDQQKLAGQKPQMARALAELSGRKGWVPTFAFRVGWPVYKPGISPRRGVDQVLLQEKK